MQLKQVAALAVVLVSGLLFGAGLAVSGMINPAKVIGFLDLAGNWDPSLILVMVGGLAVTTPAFQLSRRQLAPLLEAKFYLPGRSDLDAKLIGGAVIFGLGWGLAGLCPGPAVAALVTFDARILWFVGAMVGGMLLHRLVAE